MSTRISSSKPEVQHRRELFVAAYASSGNATQAAIAAGFGARNADVQGGRMMREAATGPRAREARDAHVRGTIDDFARQQAALRTAADGAIATLVEISAAAPRAGAFARVQAAIGILDRAGHKPVERIEQAVQWVDVNRELSAVDVAAVLREALDAIAESPDAQPGPEAE